jgi:hypothetical protein
VIAVSPAPVSEACGHYFATAPGFAPGVPRHAGGWSRLLWHGTAHASAIATMSRHVPVSPVDNCVGTQTRIAAVFATESMQSSRTRPPRLALRLRPRRRAARETAQLQTRRAADVVPAPRAERTSRLQQQAVDSITERASYSLAALRSDVRLREFVGLNR